MLKNFKISNSIELVIEDMKFDLHNNYDFVFLNWDIYENQIVLIFHKNEEFEAIKNDYRILKLKFENLKSIKISEGFFTNRVKGIEELGYKQLEDNDFNWLISEDKWKEDMLLLIRFENDEYIGVYAQKVTLHFYI